MRTKSLERRAKIMELLKEAPRGLSMRYIASSIGITFCSARENVRGLRNAGLIVRIGNASDSRWAVSERQGEILKITIETMAKIARIVEYIGSKPDGAKRIEIASHFEETEDAVKKLLKEIRKYGLAVAIGKNSPVWTLPEMVEEVSKRRASMSRTRRLNEKKRHYRKNKERLRLIRAGFADMQQDEAQREMQEADIDPPMVRRIVKASECKPPQTRGVSSIFAMGAA